MSVIQTFYELIHVFTREICKGEWSITPRAVISKIHEHRGGRRGQWEEFKRVDPHMKKPVRKG